MIISVWVVSGCVSQQPKPTEPSPPQPPINQTEQKPSPEMKSPSEARPQERKPTSPSGQEAEKSLEHQLKAAREKLRVSEETEKRVTAEFESLKQSGKATADITRDYETYQNRVQGLVAESREMVEKLEQAVAAQNKGLADKKTGKEEPVETAQLDRQLNQSLSEFDEMLLEEMDRIQAQSEQKMTSLAEEAAAAADRLREKGIDVGSGDGDKPSSSEDNRESQSQNQEANSDSTAKGSTGQAGEKGDDGRDGRTDDTETGMSGSEQARADTGGDAGGTNSNDRRRSYSEEDDDIVARQLREAAEKETDPDLKEKLWKEYEDYKRNTNQ